MPLLIFFLKTIFGIFLITWAGKFLFWVFSTDTTTEEQDEISWLEEARVRPSLLIKPALFCLFLPIVFYLGIHHIITSQAAWAGEFRSFSIAAWYYLKWPVILMTWFGINRFLYWLFFEQPGNEHWWDTLFHDLYPVSKPSWFFTTAIWFSELNWSLFSLRIVIGGASILLANAMLLWATYYQLSPTHRLLVDGLLN